MLGISATTFQRNDVENYSDDVNESNNVPRTCMGVSGPYKQAFRETLNNTACGTCFLDYPLQLQIT